MRHSCVQVFTAAGEQYLQAPELSSGLRTQPCCPGTSEEGRPAAEPQGPCPSDRSHTWPARCWCSILCRLQDGNTASMGDWADKSR